MPKIERLKELCLLPGISSREELIRDNILNHLKPKNYHIDKIGNLIINPDSKIIFLAHIDEIGFLISSITDDGKLF